MYNGNGNGNGTSNSVVIVVVPGLRGVTIRPQPSDPAHELYHYYHYCHLYIYIYIYIHAHVYRSVCTHVYVASPQNALWHGVEIGTVISLRLLFGFTVLCYIINATIRIYGFMLYH